MAGKTTRRRATAEQPEAAEATAEQPPAPTRYVADRDFNEVKAGDVLELDEDHPYTRTGYLVKVDEQSEAAADEQQGDERLPAALSRTSTGEAADGDAVVPAAEGGADSGADEGEDRAR